tara:strand:+ start:79 stop:270 length:192 start_codon:yes stop_codon:yes gene_type:complete
MKKDLEQYFVHRFTPSTFSKEEITEYEKNIIKKILSVKNYGKLIIPPEKIVDNIINEEDDYLG